MRAAVRLVLDAIGDDLATADRRHVTGARVDTVEGNGDGVQLGP
jgi:hypothetical protein